MISSALLLQAAIRRTSFHLNLHRSNNHSPTLYPLNGMSLMAGPKRFHSKRRRRLSNSQDTATRFPSVCLEHRVWSSKALQRRRNRLWCRAASEINNCRAESRWCGGCCANEYSDCSIQVSATLAGAIWRYTALGVFIAVALCRRLAGWHRHRRTGNQLGGRHWPGCLLLD